MSIADKLRSNAEVHGVSFAAQWAAKNRINISVVRYVLLGKY